MTESKKRKAITSSKSKKASPKSRSLRAKQAVAGLVQSAKTRQKAFLAKRPHRSFRRTRRRDYTRSLKLPGYVSFTSYTAATLWSHRKTIVLLVALYAAMIILLGGITNQDTFSQISSSLKSSSAKIFGSDSGAGLGQLGSAGLLTLSTFLSGPQGLTADQQILLFIALLFVWLTTVWLLREYMVGRKPKLRDGLYNAGAPIAATVAVLIVLLIQLLPIGLLAIVYAGLSSVGILDGGFSSMLFWVFAAFIAILVLYWTTSTLIALVIVTLPGMYPIRALRVAGDVVISRRLRILLRLLWGIGTIALAWGVVMIPVILLDTALKAKIDQLTAVPIVPYAGAIMTAFTVVWLAAYVYLLYRKVVDDDAKPA